MPELFGIDLPIWVLSILFLLSNKNATDFFKKILSILGIITKQDKEAEADERQYQRIRDSQILEVLRSLIEGNQAESRERDNVLKDQGRILSDLTVALHKNTDTVARLIDQMRIYGYNAAVVDERLTELKNHIQTKRLGGSK